MARYQEIADDLRRRIRAGEFPVGCKLPGISALQDEYAVPALNTIRAAQQQLVNEGLLVTRQGVGAFVTRADPLQPVDVVDTLQRAQAALTTAIAALDAPHTVSIDLDEENMFSVLTDALQDYADRHRADAAQDDDGDRSDAAAAWATTAETLLERIHAAF